MDWIKLTVTTTNEASEAVINLLMENGAGGVEIDDSDLSQVELATYFQAQAGLVELLPELEQKIAQLREFGLDPGKGTVKLAELDDDSWADVWKKYYHPVRLTRYLTIVPSWESYTPETTDEKVIKLDPGRAFGTGTHPTTKLALQALETVVRGGETMIDVGTGSGVLSIAAKYFGVAQIAAYDVDAEAVKAAEENLALNGMQDAITVGANDLLAGIKTKVGLITANILAEIIVPLIPQAYECLKPGGIFITSGIIADKKDWYSIIAHMPTTDEV